MPLLVITRRELEEIVIGDPAAPLGVVRIASIKGDRVRVALEFPREVEIHRRELLTEEKSEDAPLPIGRCTCRADSVVFANQESCEQ
jgi:carbon storage regulator